MLVLFILIEFQVADFPFSLFNFQMDVSTITQNVFIIYVDWGSIWVFWVWDFAFGSLIYKIVFQLLFYLYRFIFWWHILITFYENIIRIWTVWILIFLSLGFKFLIDFSTFWLQIIWIEYVCIHILKRRIYRFNQLNFLSERFLINQNLFIIDRILLDLRNFEEFWII